MKNPITAAEQITARTEKQALLSEKVRAKSGAQSEITLSLTGPEYRAARRVDPAAFAGKAAIVLCGTPRPRPAVPTAPPAVKPKGPKRAFKVLLDEETASRMKAFAEEFNGVSVAHVIALATANCLENTDGYDYRYQLARDVKQAAREDRFGMLRNRHEMRKYIEQLADWTPAAARERLQQRGAEWEVGVGAIVAVLVKDAVRADTEDGGKYLNRFAAKAAFTFNPDNYKAEEAAR